MPGGSSKQPGPAAWAAGRLRWQRLHLSLHAGPGHGTAASTTLALPARHGTAQPGTVSSGAGTLACYGDLHEGNKLMFSMVGDLHMWFYVIFQRWFKPKCILQEDVLCKLC